jgi:hypothetical protein
VLIVLAGFICLNLDFDLLGLLILALYASVFIFLSLLSMYLEGANALGVELGRGPA